MRAESKLSFVLTLGSYCNIANRRMTTAITGRRSESKADMLQCIKT